MKWLHNLLKGLSLTAVLFIFQACYGTPAGMPNPIPEEEAVEASAEEPETESETENPEDPAQETLKI